MPNDSPPDFFISHNSADEAWAEWISQTLEANGYSTLSMERDFRPGNNFVLRMHEAARQGIPVLAVVSPDYLESHFGSPEWAAAFADDPQGLKRRLIPVVVATVERSGLLNQIVPIDLRGKTEEQAVAALLEGVGSGRRVPTESVPFPGSVARPPSFAPATATSEWQALNGPVQLQVRENSRAAGSWDSSVVLELYLIPMPAARLQMRDLRTMPDVLAAAGRSSGLFTGSEAIHSTLANEVASATSQSGRGTTTRGLSINRSGQVSVWDALPQDGMGAVIDASNVEQRLVRLIRIAVAAFELHEDRYAPAARVVASGLFIFGDASSVGARSSASGLNTGGQIYVADAEDTVSRQLLEVSPEEVAAELAARLASGWPEPTTRGW